jgi:hypothetical protein
VAATSAATPPPIDCGERDASRTDQSQSFAFIRNQPQSIAISIDQSQSAAIHQSQSIAISTVTPDPAAECNQTSSEVISRNQSQSAWSHLTQQQNTTARLRPRREPALAVTNATCTVLDHATRTKQESPRSAHVTVVVGNHRATHLMREAITEQPT